MSGKIALTDAAGEEMAAIRKRLDPVVAAKLAEVDAAGIDGEAAFADLKAEIAKVEAGQ